MCMTVYNVTERLAKEMIASPEVQGVVQCSCAQCLDDILAIALNHLPARYVSTDQGGTYVKADYMHPQWQSDVLAELIRAAEVVGRQPHHGLLTGERV
ncbi:hypothetical protein N007_00335 [Alicyclobacillus acidoterrestris ATCC 49025]|nr:hypothetical protein N007_00335 [Alicyclobacillus acidoterrestris ATCC 49025]